MKILKLCLFFLILATSVSTWALPPMTIQHQAPVQIYGKAETVFPLFVGAGVGLNFVDQFDFSVMYGLTPEPYYQVIGEAAAQYGGNSAYKDVIEASFKNNSIIRAAGNYFFNSARSGWLAGGAFSYLTSNGKAGVDKVLTAATGKDYFLLRQALTNAGKNPEVDLDAKIMIIDVRGGYSWDLGHDFILKASIGVAKVISSEVNLKSGLAFETTPYGDNLMRTAESDIQSIINDYGISPTLGLEMNYLF